MKKLLEIFLLVVTFCLFISSSSFATLIDFREHEPFKTDQPNDWNSYSAMIGSLSLTFTPLGTQNSNKLYWDKDDGFGVKGGGYEGDEIEDPEALKIHFSTPTYVSYFDLTDLFFEGGYEEEGSWSLDNTNWTYFFQTDHSVLPSPVSNGEYTLWINSNVSDIWFTAPGKKNCNENHEFSVAAVDINPVPEPATMLLLGSGLIGIAGLGRKFRKK